MRKAVIVLCLSAVLGCLSGCVPTKEYEANPAILTAFDSAGGLEGYFAENSPGTSTGSAIESLLTLGRGGGTIPYYTEGVTIPYQPAAGFVGGLVGSSASLQDCWADEMTMAQMEGDYLYVLDGFGLSIVKAVPADQMEVVGHFDIVDIDPYLFQLLDDHKAVIVSANAYADYEWYTSDEEGWLPYYADYFRVYLLDLQDPTEPVLLARYSIQGEILAPRVVDGNKLCLMVANYPEYTYYYDYTAAEMTTNEILPLYKVVTSDNTGDVQPLLTYDKVLYPANPDGNALLALATIDLEEAGSAPEAIGFLGYWDNVYQTPSSVYLTNTPYKPGGEYSFRTTTEVHCFDITGASPRYAGSVKLDGRTAPYGSFSEIDGRLCVATARIDDLEAAIDYFYGYYGYFSEYTYYSLEPTDAGLETVSRTDQSLDPFCPYESYFVGKYAVIDGYERDSEEMVSYVADVSNSAAPELLGKGTWPVDWDGRYGLDDTHILTMGWQWVEPNDPDDYRTTFELRMYDTTQPLVPEVTQTLVVGEGDTDSDATYYPEEMYLADGLLILPVEFYEGPLPDETGLPTFTGLYIYRLSTANGFELIGRVETADPYRYVWWHRPIVRDGILYAVTNGTVRSVALDDAETILSSLRLPY